MPKHLRALFLLAAFSLFIGLFCVGMAALPAKTIPIDSKTAEDDSTAEDAPLKVLFIGNSHTRDSTAYLYQLVASAGYADMIVGSAYINASSIQNHCLNIESGDLLYTYRKETNKITKTTSRGSLPELIRDEDWDMIILQENAARSGMPEYYNEELDQLISGVRNCAQNPDIKVGWFMPWAFAADYNSSTFRVYNNDQMAMYSAITDATQTYIVPHPGIDFVIPVGTALQNARGGYMGDTFNGDGSHLDHSAGFYLAALCHFRYITSQSLTDMDVMPGAFPALPSDDWPMLRDAVEDTISSPFTATPTKHAAAPLITVYYDLPAEYISAELSAAAYTYTSNPHMPLPVLTHSPKTLKKDIDYILTYKNNKAAGVATVTATGIGHYTGSLSFSFAIKPKALNELSIPIPSAGEYTGDSVLPSFNLRYGSHTLVLNVDYTVSCENNINVGTADVKLVGIGNFTGEVNRIFVIKQKPVKKLTFSTVSDKTYTQDYITPKLTVKNGSRTLKSGVDYTVEYQNNLTAGKALIIVTGQGSYTGTAEIPFNILPLKPKAKNLSIGTLKSVTYNGKIQKPLPAVKYGDVLLKKGVDYTLSYSNAKNAGTALVTITFKGNYSGTASQTFIIKPISLSKLTLEAIPQQTYKGKALQPKVTLRFNTKLKSGRDYTLRYKNNISRGTATVTIQGVGNFKGKLTQTFKIV